MSILTNKGKTTFLKILYKYVYGGLVRHEARGGSRPGGRGLGAHNIDK